MLQTVVSIILVGTICGALGAGIIVLLFRRHWVPDFLHNSFVLAMVLFVFAGADELRHQSGLFATMMMGLVLANQRKVSVHHVVEFKESVTVLLISPLVYRAGSGS